MNPIDFLSAYVYNKINPNQKYEIASFEDYWNTPSVKEAFKTEENFTKIYGEVSKQFAELQQMQSAIDLDNYVQEKSYSIDNRPMIPVLEDKQNAKPFVISVTEIPKNKWNDELWKGQELGFAGKDWSKTQNTISEIAKWQPYKNEDGSFSKSSAAMDFLNPFDNLKVLARDEQGKLKLNNGKPYYEEKSLSSNPDDIKKDDILRWNNTSVFTAPFIRDVFGTDMVEKSVLGSAMYNAGKIGMMIEPAGQIALAIMEIPTFAGALSSIGRSAVNATGLFDSKLQWKTLNNIINWSDSFEMGTSEYAKNNSWALENILNMAGDVSNQLSAMRNFAKFGAGMANSMATMNAANKIKQGKQAFETAKNALHNAGLLSELDSPIEYQKAITLLSSGINNLESLYKTAKGIDKLDEGFDVVKDTYSQLSKYYKSIDGKLDLTKPVVSTINTKAINYGSQLGIGYAIATAGASSKEAFKQAGFNEQASSIGQLLVLSALGVVIKTDIGSWAIKNLTVNQHQNVIKKAVIDGLVTGKLDAQAVQKSITNSFTKLYNAIRTGGGDDYKFYGLMSAGLAETLEESSEYFVETGVQSMFNTLHDLGVVKANTLKDKPFTFDNFTNELLLSALGGFMGGVIAKSAFKFDNQIKSDANLLELIAMRRENEIYEAIDNLAEKELFPTQLDEKGKVVSKELGMNNVIKQNMKNAVKNTVMLRDALNVPTTEDMKRVVNVLSNKNNVPTSLYASLNEDITKAFNEATELLKDDTLSADVVKTKLGEIKKTISELSKPERLYAKLYSTLLNAAGVNKEFSEKLLKDDDERKDFLKEIETFFKDNLKDFTKQYDSFNDVEKELENEKVLKSKLGKIIQDRIVKRKEILKNNTFVNKKDNVFNNYTNDEQLEKVKYALFFIEKLNKTDNDKIKQDLQINDELFTRFENLYINDIENINDSNYEDVEILGSVLNDENDIEELKKQSSELKEFIKNENEITTLTNPENLKENDLQSRIEKEVFDRSNQREEYGIADTNTINNLKDLQSEILNLQYIYQLNNLSRNFKSLTTAELPFELDLQDNLDFINYLDNQLKKVNELIKYSEENLGQIEKKIKKEESDKLFKMISLVKNIVETIDDGKPFKQDGSEFTFSQLLPVTDLQYNTEEAITLRTNLFAMVTQLREFKNNSEFKNKLFEIIKSYNNDVISPDKIDEKIILVMMDRLSENDNLEKFKDSFLNALNNDKVILQSQFYTLLQAYLFAISDKKDYFYGYKTDDDKNFIKDYDTFNKNVIFVSGIFGSGKGVVANYLFKMLEHSGKNVYSYAPNNNVRENFDKQLNTDDTKLFENLLSDKNLDDEDAVFLLDEATFIYLVENKKENFKDIKAKLILIGDDQQQGLRTDYDNFTVATYPDIERTNRILFSVRSGTPEIHRQLEESLKILKLSNDYVENQLDFATKYLPTASAQEISLLYNSKNKYPFTLSETDLKNIGIIDENNNSLLPKSNYYIKNDEIRGFKASNESNLDSFLKELIVNNKLEEFANNLLIIYNNSSLLSATKFKDKVESLMKDLGKSITIKMLNNNEVQGSQEKYVVNFAQLNANITNFELTEIFLKSYQTMVSRSTHFHFLVTDNSFPLPITDSKLSSRDSQIYNNFLTTDKNKKELYNSWIKSLSLSEPIKVKETTQIKETSTTSAVTSSDVSKTIDDTVTNIVTNSQQQPSKDVTEDFDKDKTAQVDKTKNDELKQKLNIIVEKVKTDLHSKNLTIEEQDLLKQYPDLVKSLEDFINQSKLEQIKQNDKDQVVKSSISYLFEYTTDSQRNTVADFFENDYESFFEFNRQLWILIDDNLKNDDSRHSYWESDLFKKLIKYQKFDEKHEKKLFNDEKQKLKNAKKYLQDVIKKTDKLEMRVEETKPNGKSILIYLTIGKNDYNLPEEIPIAKFDFYKSQSETNDWYANFWNNAKVGNVYEIPKTSFKEKEGLKRLSNLTSGLGIYSGKDNQREDKSLKEFREIHHTVSVSDVFTVKEDFTFNGEIVTWKDDKISGYKGKAIVLISSNERLINNQELVDEGNLGGAIRGSEVITPMFVEVQPIITKKTNDSYNDEFKKYVEILFNNLNDYNSYFELTPERREKKYEENINNALRWLNFGLNRTNTFKALNLFFNANKEMFYRKMNNLPNDAKIEDSKLKVYNFINYINEVIINSGLINSPDVNLKINWTNAIQVAIRAILEEEHNPKFNNENLTLVLREIVRSMKGDSIENFSLTMLEHFAKVNNDNPIRLTIQGIFSDTKEAHLVKASMPSEVKKIFNLTDSQDLEDITTVKGGYSFGKIYFDFKDLSIKTKEKMKNEEKEKDITVVPKVNNTPEPNPELRKVKDLTVYEKLFNDITTNENGEVVTQEENLEFKKFIDEFVEWDLQNEKKWQGDAIKNLFSVVGSSNIDNNLRKNYSENVRKYLFSIKDKSKALSSVKIAEKITNKIIKIDC